MIQYVYTAIIMVYLTIYMHFSSPFISLENNNNNNNKKVQNGKCHATSLLFLGFLYIGNMRPPAQDLFITFLHLMYQTPFWGNHIKQ